MDYTYLLRDVLYMILFYLIGRYLYSKAKSGNIDNSIKSVSHSKVILSIAALMIFVPVLISIILGSSEFIKTSVIIYIVVMYVGMGLGLLLMVSAYSLFFITRNQSRSVKNLLRGGIYLGVGSFYMIPITAILCFGTLYFLKIFE
jgi:hypothetical protein